MLNVSKTKNEKLDIMKRYHTIRERPIESDYKKTTDNLTKKINNDWIFFENLMLKLIINLSVDLS